jgi:uncharacterized protein (DUF305 family)
MVTLSRISHLRRAVSLLLIAVAGVHAQAPRETAGVLAARADSARYPWSAADARFMTDMIGHHAQAVVMSRMAPSHGASAAVQRLAARIINAQLDEIRTMQVWLRDRNQPAPDPLGTATPTTDHTNHANHSMDHGDHAMMPGMLTAAQLAQLDAARGAEFDQLFLEFMIQHHRGATFMVDQLFKTDGAGQDLTIFKFASDVNVDQVTEIARMQRMLVDVLFVPVRP